MKDRSHKILVIGGGPAGLTATYDLAKKNAAPVCLEADTILGGISRTVEFKGFRFDIGGHRFFSKIKRVNGLWDEVLGDEFLIRPRLSRIYYRNKFFNYPLKPWNALTCLGLIKSVQIVISYIKAQILPISDERTFEHWVTNRFGSRLYEIFFKTYTEKLWGISCQEIQAEWAAQRIKGLSLWSAVIDVLFKRNNIKTLINEFKYPRFGPGQMYEAMAQKAGTFGADIKMNHRVSAIEYEGTIISGVIAKTPEGLLAFPCSYLISSMPITDLVLRLRPEPPPEVVAAAKALRYRAMLTVNLLINEPTQLPDNWIYVHDSTVRMGRVQFFSNWSPYMVPDEKHSSLGLEYFCWEDDELWSMSDSSLLALGTREAIQLGLLCEGTIFDGFVIRMPKCYPVYDETYHENITIIRQYLEQFTNLALCGRYGLFKYNNMDHSILTALYAAENAFGGKNDVWAVNADEDYHEEVR